MKPSQTLIDRMCRRYRRLQKRINAGLVNKIDADPVYGHEDFSRMVWFAVSIFTETDFRWLMRLDDHDFLTDVRTLFDLIDPQSGVWKIQDVTPWFVVRSDIANKRKLGRKGGAQ